MNGLLQLSVWQIVLAALILTHISIVSVTVYLHRYSAHRALSLHPALQHFFRFWLWLTTATNTLEWTAVHRKHHAKCDTEEDPHSPVILGINKVLWQGAEVYRKAATDQETLKRYGSGCPNDWIERNLYSRFPNVGIMLMALIDLLCFGVLGITVWAVQMIWMPFFAGGVINGMGHYFGYRNFECSDASTNIVPWGILVGGEELHGNHHTYPSSAKLSIRPWEFDIGYAYIRLFSLLKLAEVRKLPPKTAYSANKQHIDIDTLRALVKNRFQIMDSYRKSVIKPVWRNEKRQADGTARQLFRRAKRLLYRDDNLISTKARVRLDALIHDNAALAATYQFRQRLQQIANRASKGSQDALEALKLWVQEAEESGIEVLAEFARQLRGHIPMTATS